MVFIIIVQLEKRRSHYTRKHLFVSPLHFTTYFSNDKKKTKQDSTFTIPFLTLDKVFINKVTLLLKTSNLLS